MVPKKLSNLAGLECMHDTEKVNPTTALSRGTDGPPAGARSELSARSEGLGRPPQSAPSVPRVTPVTTGKYLAVPSTRTHVRSDGSRLPGHA
jgi:hypothetical protein